MAIRARTTVSDVRRGMDRLLRDVRELNHAYTKIGFPEEASVAGPSKKGSGHEAVSDMADMAFIAGVHEFGAPAAGIPQRAFLRPAFDKNKEALHRMQQRVFSQVINRQISVRAGLALLGEFMVARVRTQIRKLRTPPLKPATIARKRSRKLLIDTGQMINSVTHVEVTR